MLASFPVRAEEPVSPSKGAGIHLSSHGFSSSKKCGQCHQQLFADWEHSLHAKSSDNAVFHAAYLQVYFEQGERARPACLNCHAPVAYYNNDPKLTQPVSREGVSCDFCHSIAEILPGTPDGPQFRFEFGGVKQGPLKNAKSSAHQTQFNNLFRQSLFCKGCHEQAASKGFKMIETYSEWQASPYPEKGVACQTCHMEKIPGKTVAASTGPSSVAQVSNHDIAAGHSLTRRRQALEIKIVQLRTFRNRITVQVDLTNSGAGHKMPTGLPAKKIVLEVQVESRDGGKRQIQQKFFQKVLVDRKGRVVSNLVDMMLGKAEKVLSDNRIAPLETRSESFTFFVDDPQGQTVSAAAYYSYTPQIIQPSPVKIKLSEVKVLVR
ncbi:MAG: hypothetical protein GWN10_21435 [Nitrospinaceae bacterium]|nr:hypothetical protein [Nitrospinaceae bacterium]NIX36677.1 hypothetical protein [Nitrospinaceae bacterium]